MIHLLVKHLVTYDEYLYLSVDGWCQEKGKKHVTDSIRSYIYEYSDSGKFIPIQRELYNTPRSSIVPNYNMEPTEIG